jgi:hypothetical protein
MQSATTRNQQLHASVILLLYRPFLFLSFPTPVFLCCVLPSGLVCSIIFLTYTVSPKARRAGCGGNAPGCVFYTCDLGWDVFWAVLWGGTFIVNVMGSYRNTVGVAIASIAFSVAMFLLYVTTAVMSRKVRQAVVAERDNGDIEAAAAPPVVGVMARDVYTIGTVGGVPVSDASGSRDARAKPTVSAKV